MKNRPSWYTNDNDASWDRVKTAFRRDWEQTKHDFGSDHAPDLNQNAADTVRQATGSESTFETREPAFRFGHAAQTHYRKDYPTWNDDLQTKLRSDYGDDFDRDRDDIRRAYEYRYNSGAAIAEDQRDKAGLR
jgi:hypothetical protein